MNSRNVKAERHSVVTRIRREGDDCPGSQVRTHSECSNNGQTWREVAVARAKKAKFDAVNEQERYELNVNFRAEPDSRDTKNGVAVIITVPM